MPFVLADRVKETTTTTGTGTVTLAGAVTGFRSFAAIGDGNVTYYTITDGTNWEVGIGTYTASGTTLSRTTILSSSNSGSAVNFPAGTKDVFVTSPASKGLYADNSGFVGIGTTTPAKELHISSVDANGTTLRFENTDTTVVLNDSLGNIEFFSNDASTNANGVRAKIAAIATGATGGTALRMYATAAASTTLVNAASVTNTGLSTTILTTTTGINNKTIDYGTVVMTNADTQTDVDLTARFTAAQNYNYFMKVEVNGLYDSGAGAYARLFKYWQQNINYSGTAFVIAGATLIGGSGYNSDATNFPAGAVNASKVLTVVSATTVVLRLQNRTTPAAGSTTYYTYVVEVLPN